MSKQTKLIYHYFMYTSRFTRETFYWFREKNSASNENLSNLKAFQFLQYLFPSLFSQLMSGSFYKKSIFFPHSRRKKYYHHKSQHKMNFHNALTSCRIFWQ